MPKQYQICLAPLKGVTDALFRSTYGEFFTGVDWAITPFLSTTRGSRIKPSHIKEVLPENNKKLPIVPQVMSKRAENFIPLAMVLNDLGYDTINLNMGCPYPMVAKKGRGSGMLMSPDVVERFLDRALAVLPCQLSIKMRLGRNREDEIFQLLPILNRYPLKEIIIHPRTGVQMYQGKPHLDIFEQCLALCQHPVMYNGDIVDTAGFDLLHRRFPGIKTWMVGRGAVADPFLCGAIKGQKEDAIEKHLLFRQFHDALYARYGQKLYGPSHLLNRMKGLWTYFTKSLDEGPALWKKIKKTLNLNQYEMVVNDFFENGPIWL